MNIRIEKVLERDIDLLIINKIIDNDKLLNLFLNKINKSEYKVYNMTVLVENKEKLDKYIVDLQNLSFIKKVERYIN